MNLTKHSPKSVAPLLNVDGALATGNAVVKEAKAILSILRSNKNNFGQSEYQAALTLSKALGALRGIPYAAVSPNADQMPKYTRTYHLDKLSSKIECGRSELGTEIRLSIARGVGLLGAITEINNLSKEVFGYPIITDFQTSPEIDTTKTVFSFTIFKNSDNMFYKGPEPELCHTALLQSHARYMVDPKVLMISAAIYRLKRGFPEPDLPLWTKDPGDLFKGMGIRTGNCAVRWNCFDRDLFLRNLSGFNGPVRSVILAGAHEPYLK